MSVLRTIKDAFLHLLFPQVCSGCGRDVFSEQSPICLNCLAELPETHFENHPDNPVEKIFWGRLSLYSASSLYYFSKESLVQRLLHAFKYRGEREIGLQLGRIMGTQLRNNGRFPIDALVPLPLFPRKQKKRGFNQAEILCEGMSEVLKLPVWGHLIIRPSETETQTRKGRVERWKNMEGKFFLTEPDKIKRKHILLVDDVVTTGSTLESCGQELLKAEGVRLSVATLCMASR